MDSRESELLQDLQSMGYIPPCVAEKKPFLNQKFKNLQSALNSIENMEEFVVSIYGKHKKKATV